MKIVNGLPSREYRKYYSSLLDMWLIADGYRYFSYVGRGSIVLKRSSTADRFRKISRFGDVRLGFRALPCTGEFFHAAW